jgi:ADP-ribosylglycohydrolase
MPVRHRAIAGSLLGTAVGDALGLPYEGLSRRRAKRLLGPPTRYRLLPGWGMASDDTEHACMTLQALMLAGDDVDEFARQLARRLRLWLLGAPAGIGLATLKATLKLWAGVPPSRSGVFSAGNGPAMRAAVLGAAIEELETLARFVRASTRVTHTDPKAEYGALAIARAARLACNETPVSARQFTDEVRGQIPAGAAGDEFIALLHRMTESLDRGESTVEFADALGLARGVSGYIYHTAPVALHAWLSHPRELREAVEEIVSCGGDADSTAAVVGGIIGCSVGREGIPAEWLARLAEWPRTVRWMEELSQRTYEARISRAPAEPPRLPWWGVVPRNAAFAAIVLAHGFRRLLPPY